MKPEPLKNKQFGYRNTRRGYQTYFLELDIKSAVEWLKKKIGKSNDSDTICMSKGELYEWIDEAFEDVVKKIKLEDE